MERQHNCDLRNLHYLKSNINVDINRFLNDIKKEQISIAEICVQFPDPLFKYRYVIRYGMMRSICR
jgi:tRNA G46 methylase TrmB